MRCTIVYELSVSIIHEGKWEDLQKSGVVLADE